MDSWHGHLGLVLPGPTELSLRTGEYGPWLGVDEEFGHFVGCHPRRVRCDDLVYITRFAIDGYLAWPCERGPPGFSRVDIGGTVNSHLLVGQISYDRGGEDAFDEDVPIENHGLSCIGPQAFEYGPSRFGPGVPRDRPHDRLHVDDAENPITMAVRPIEAKSRSPVVDDQRHPVTEVECLEQFIEVLAVLDERIAVSARIGQLIRVSHADEVRRYAAV